MVNTLFQEQNLCDSGGDSTEDLSRGSQLSLLYTPRRNKNISGSEATFLVECDKETDRTICGEVSSVPASEVEHQRPAELLQPLPIPE